MIEPATGKLCKYYKRLLILEAISFPPMAKWLPNAKCQLNTMITSLNGKKAQIDDLQISSLSRTVIVRS